MGGKTPVDSRNTSTADKIVGDTLLLNRKHLVLVEMSYSEKSEFFVSTLLRTTVRFCSAGPTRFNLKNVANKK